MSPLTCHNTVATQNQTAVRCPFTQYCHTRILPSKGQVGARWVTGHQMKFKDTPQYPAASREYLRLVGGWNSKWMRQKQMLSSGVKRSALEKQPWPDTQLDPTYWLRVHKLRCRKRVCPGSLPDFAKEIKAQESSCTSSNGSRSFLRGS